MPMIYHYKEIETKTRLVNSRYRVVFMSGFLLVLMGVMISLCEIVFFNLQGFFGFVISAIGFLVVFLSSLFRKTIDDKYVIEYIPVLPGFEPEEEN